jgi:hypothetical protein
LLKLVHHRCRFPSALIVSSWVGLLGGMIPVARISPESDRLFIEKKVFGEITSYAVKIGGPQFPFLSFSCHVHGARLLASTGHRCRAAVVIRIAVARTQNRVVRAQ